MDTGLNFAELDQLLDDYWQVLEGSLMTDSSVEDYYYFAFCFVRWCKGDFTPGANVRRQIEMQARREGIS